MFKSVVFVSAHPDDVEMNAGGTIRKFVSLGCHVSVLCMTGVGVRRDEASEACAALGVQSLMFMDAQDTMVELETASLISRVDALLNRIAPDTVITHFHADTHQDHVATYKITVAAARNVKNFMMFKPTYPSGRPDIPFHPTIISLLDAQQMEAKVRAINCFGSQRKKYGDDQWAQAMTAVAAGDAWTYAGVHGHAEVFQAGRLILG